MDGTWLWLSVSAGLAVAIVLVVKALGRARSSIKPNGATAGDEPYDSFKWCVRQSMGGQMTHLAQGTTTIWAACGSQAVLWVDGPSLSADGLKCKRCLKLLAKIEREKASTK